jgi:hypothetical protein
MTWEPRTYRRTVDAVGLVTFEVVLAETDLQISASADLSGIAADLVRSLRADLKGYIATHPRFAESYVPVEVEPGAPEIVRAMADAARVAGVGPMAAVAGAIAERVARGLAGHAAEVIVENGGDLFVIGRTQRLIALVAGDSPLSGTVAIALPPEMQPAAVCTSSGKVGHSVSHGSSHAVTIVASDGALADAVATAVGNTVHDAGDVEPALERARAIEGVRGAVVIAGESIGAAGGVTLVPVRG